MPTYKIGLLNYSFDADENNVRLFSSKTERDNYFDTQIVEWSELVNFNANNLINTTQTYQIKDENNLLHALNCNLAVIKNDTTRFYFFITRSQQLGGKIIELTLQIADLLTYWYDIDFTNCLINRTHLNRFIEDLTDPRFVSFNNGVKSLLLNQDLDNFPKYLSQRNTIVPLVDTSSDNSPINSILINNRITWLLIYFKTDELFPKNLDDPVLRTKLKPNYIDNGTYVVFAPLYNSDYPNIYKFYLPKLPWSEGEWELWDANRLLKKLEDSQKRDFILNVKLTPICPIEVKDYLNGRDYEVDSNNNVRWKFNVDGNLPSTNQWRLTGSPDGDSIWIASLRYQQQNEPFINYTIPVATTFLKSTIVNSNNNMLFNPILLSTNFRELRLTDYSGENFVYDIQKINQNNITIKFREGINSDITKTYTRIVGLRDSVYRLSTDNYLGLVSSIDSSIPYAVTQIEQFLANNKNFNMLRILNVGSMFASIFGGDRFKMTPKTVGGDISNIGIDQIKESLTLNNMENAPNSIQNASGSILFNSMINLELCLKFYVDIHTSTPNDLAKAHDYITRFGFNYNRWGNINEHIRTRKYYNYIQAQLELINGNLSNDLKMRIKQKLNNGVRFWHTDKIDYTKENYERWLENGTTIKKT